MFRRLFTLELIALRDQLDQLRHIAQEAEGSIADTARDVLAIKRHAGSPGIWNLRLPG